MGRIRERRESGRNGFCIGRLSLSLSLTIPQFPFRYPSDPRRCPTCVRAVCPACLRRGHRSELCPRARGGGGRASGKSDITPANASSLLRFPNVCRSERRARSSCVVRLRGNQRHRQVGPGKLTFFSFSVLPAGHLSQFMCVRVSACACVRVHVCVLCACTLHGC